MRRTTLSVMVLLLAIAVGLPAMSTPAEGRDDANPSSSIIWPGDDALLLAGSQTFLVASDRADDVEVTVNGEAVADLLVSSTGTDVSKVGPITVASGDRVEVRAGSDVSEAGVIDLTTERATLRSADGEARDPLVPVTASVDGGSLSLEITSGTPMQMRAFDIDIEGNLTRSGLGYIEQTFDLRGAVGHLNVGGKQVPLELSSAAGDVTFSVLGQFMALTERPEVAHVAPVTFELASKRIEIPVVDEVAGILGSLPSLRAGSAVEGVLDLSGLEGVAESSACSGTLVCQPGSTLTPDPLPVVIPEADAMNLASSFDQVALLTLSRRLEQAYLDSGEPIVDGVEGCVEALEMWLPLNPSAAQGYCKYALADGVVDQLGGDPTHRRLAHALVACSMHKNDVWCGRALKIATNVALEETVDNTMGLTFTLLQDPLDFTWSLGLPFAPNLEQFGVEYPDPYPIYAAVNETLVDLDLATITAAKPVAELVEGLVCAGTLPCSGPMQTTASTTKRDCMARDGQRRPGQGHDCWQYVYVSTGGLRMSDSPARYLFRGAIVASKTLNDGGSANRIGIGVQAIGTSGWTYGNNDPARDTWAMRGSRYHYLDQNQIFDSVKECWYSPIGRFRDEPGEVAATATDLTGFVYANGRQFDGWETSRHVARCDGMGSQDPEWEIAYQYVDAILRPQPGAEIHPGDMNMSTGYVHNRRTWAFNFTCSGQVAYPSGVGVFCSVSPEPQERAEKLWSDGQW